MMTNSSLIFPAWITPSAVQSTDIAFTKVKLSYGWLGCMAPFPIIYGGHRFRTSEALFQWLRFDGHPGVRAQILAQASPMMAKDVARTNRGLLGRGVMWDESGPDIELMQLCLRLKIEQYPYLATLLSGTGDAMIVEDCTTHPRESAEFWGAVRRGSQWHGKNVLGCLWMERREGLRQ
jgi:N-glycosidase YbiA